MTLRLAIPDLISPSYFPIIAAVEMGLVKKEGFDARCDLVYPVTKTYQMLHDGELDMVVGAAHAPLYAFKDWAGARLLCAISQNMYWFLVVKASLNVRRNDLLALKGLKIGAAPGPADGLTRMLQVAGLEPGKDVHVVPVPGLGAGAVSFGVNAARALQEGKLDGFWANGMGMEVAVRAGYGTVVVDARRDGPEEAKGYTFPALVCTEKLLAGQRQAAAAVVRAVKAAQQALKADPASATGVACKLFPPQETSLIAELIGRDAPFYDAAIPKARVESMNRFAQALGLLSRPVPYESIVADVS